MSKDERNLSCDSFVSQIESATEQFDIAWYAGARSVPGLLSFNEID